MGELNQQLYKASYEVLTQQGVPEPLADAASRVIATDEAGKPNLGRNEDDIQVCHAVMDIYHRLQRNTD
jgi:hypothetical protein